jgi:hypothetical protein
MLLIINSYVLYLNIESWCSHLLIYHFILTSHSLGYHMNLILLIMIIDLLSTMNFIIILYGNRIWYYYMFQSGLTFLLWLAFLLGYHIYTFYYMKLGLGLGAHYLPMFYHYLYRLNRKIILLIYLGQTNILFMFLPIFLMYILKTLNLLTCLFILSFHWLYKLCNNMWLYSLCISTLLLCSIYYLILTFHLMSHSFYHFFYKIYFFTLSSCFIFLFFIVIIVFNMFGIWCNKKSVERLVSLPT